MKMRRAFPDKF
jgi:tubulin polyglutamylase TTLL6/13